MSNDKRLIRFAKGSGQNLGKAKNVTESWLGFDKILKKPVVTSERQKDFAKMTDREQATLKGINGWIFRAPIEGSARNRSSAMPSDMISLDFDYMTPEYLNDLLSGKICPQWEWIFHSSRRHTAEKPRGRIYILLNRPLPPDTYGAASRIIGQQFDPSMTHVDKVSFRVAQMMYLPTASKDGEFVHYRNHGQACDWSTELDTYELTVGDWHDLSKLPIVPDEKLRETSEKAEDPTTKKGPVGDFCRAYDIPEAIAKFLPDKYTPTDDHSAKPRYTYLGGTTTNGAEVQDDGLFLFSHHGSDPCGDMLVNSFDLVRIHLFGALDTDVDTETTGIAKRPSWKNMIEFIQEDEGYRKSVVTSRYDIEAMNADFDLAMEGEEVEISDEEEKEIDDLVGTPTSRDIHGAPISHAKKRKLNRREPPDKDWISKMETTLQGALLSNSANVSQIVENDRRFRDSIAYNVFHDRIVLREPLRTKLPYLTVDPVPDPLKGLPMQDRHISQIRILLESPAGEGKPGYGLKSVADRDLKAAVDQIAWNNHFHPVVEYLESMQSRYASESDLDGNERVETVFIRYFGCPDNVYYRTISKLFLLAAVARAYEPGHKFDFVPILCGAQGKRKSTFIRIMAKSWFGELKADFRDEKKVVEQMMGFWMMELPELSSIGRSQIEDVKACVSSTSSSMRMAYAHMPQEFKRQCVFIGSTNDEQYLIDPTGNRRWWPVPVVIDQIDTDALALEVDAIWGATVRIYKAMRQEQPEGDLPLYLTDPEAIRISEGLQEEAMVYTEADTYAAAIVPYLNSHIDDENHDDFDIGMESPKRVRRRFVTIAEIWINALEQNVKHTQTDAKAIGRAIRKCGWETPPVKNIRIEGVPTTIYVPNKQTRLRWKKEDDEAAREQQ